MVRRTWKKEGEECHICRQEVEVGGERLVLAWSDFSFFFFTLHFIQSGAVGHKMELPAFRVRLLPSVKSLSGNTLEHAQSVPG